MLPTSNGMTSSSFACATRRQTFVMIYVMFGAMLTLVFLGLL